MKNRTTQKEREAGVLGQVCSFSNTELNQGEHLGGDVRHEPEEKRHQNPRGVLG